MYDKSLLAKATSGDKDDDPVPDQLQGQDVKVVTKDKSFLARLFVPKTAEEVTQKNDQLMYERWGLNTGLTYEMVQRYWTSQRVGEHWRDLYQHQPRKFMKYLKKGYMEPIPTE